MTQLESYRIALGAERNISSLLIEVSSQCSISTVWVKSTHWSPAPCVQHLPAALNQGTHRLDFFSPTRASEIDVLGWNLSSSIVGVLENFPASFQARLEALEAGFYEALQHVFQGPIHADDVVVNNMLTPTKLQLPLTMYVQGDSVPMQNAIGLALADKGDVLRWAAPISAQYYSFDALDWLDYSSPPEWRKLTDGKGDSDISIDYTHRRIRLTYDLQNSYYMGAFIQIQQNYPPFGLKVTLEESDDSNSWTTLIAERTLAPSPVLILSSDGRGYIYRRYVRMTIEALMGVPDTWCLAGLQLITFRPGNQGGTGLHRLLPITWDETGNITARGWLQGVHRSSVGQTGITKSISFKDLEGLSHDFTFQDGILVNHTAS